MSNSIVTRPPSPYLTLALDSISEGAKLAHHDARQAALDACVLAIAEQLHVASAALLYQVPQPWGSLSMQAQGIYIAEAKAAVAQRSALMRTRATRTMLDRVSDHVEAQAGEDNDLALDTQHWLAQRGATWGIDAYARALRSEYDKGAR